MLTRGAQVTGVAVCSLSLTWISVSLRFYVRVCMLKFVGKEDWLTVAAMIIFSLLCGLLLVLTTYGLGAHLHSIPPAWLPIAAKYTFISELLYVACTAVTKLSIGVYFLRLASPKSPYQRAIIHINMCVVAVYSTVYFFFLIFQCHPVGNLWVQYEPAALAGQATGRCLSGNALANATYAHAAMSALTDWAFGILPVFFVWGMQMNPKTKLSVVLILSLGFFASTATIVRIVYIHALTLTPDYSWEGINLVKWSMVEPAIGITAANISTLRPLFQKLLNSPHHLPFVKPSRHHQQQNHRSTKSLHSASSEDGADVDYDDTSSNGGSRPATGGRGGNHGNNNNGGNNNTGKLYGWNEEFAGLLGLQTTGVTTHISAGHDERDTPLAILRKVLRRRKDGNGDGDDPDLPEDEGAIWRGDVESQDGGSGKEGRDGGDVRVVPVSGGWGDLMRGGAGGIVKTVTTTFDR